MDHFFCASLFPHPQLVYSGYINSHSMYDTGIIVRGDNNSGNVYVCVFFTLTDRASTIPVIIRGLLDRKISEGTRQNMLRRSRRVQIFLQTNKTKSP